MKFRVGDILVYLLFLFPIGTILSDTGAFGDVVNKVLYGVLAVFLLGRLFKMKLPRRFIFSLIVLAVVYGYSIAVTEWPLYNVNELFYLGTWVVYINYVIYDMDNFRLRLETNKKVTRNLVIIWEAIILISFFVPDCYVNSAFASFSGSPHRMASAATMILSGVLFLYKLSGFKARWWLLTIIPAIAIVLSGVRTYMVVLGGILIAFYYFLNMKKQFNFYLTVIPIIVLGVLIILSTSIMQMRLEDIQKEGEYLSSVGYDAWAAITSGRSVFWAIDLQQYWKSPILNRILGNGFHFVRYINSVFYTQQIWAHNDFINILCCNGIAGLILYFQAYINLTKQSLKHKHTSKGKWVLLGCFHLICMFNAMFNMLYSYFVATLAVPIFALALFDEEQMTKHSVDVNKSAVS